VNENIKRYAPLAALTVVLIVLVVLFFTSGDEHKLPSEITPPDLESQTQPDEEREIRTVILYFLSEDDSRLHPEEREIFAEESEILEARLVMEELLLGPRKEGISTFPPETKLRELYITPEGVAVVDFSRELQTDHISGTNAETATVFAIVNTLTRNFNSIKRVFILIDGSERETLKGHIDLRQPLLPRYDLVDGSSPAS